jgi:hypothetical protein
VNGAAGRLFLHLLGSLVCQVVAGAACEARDSRFAEAWEQSGFERLPWANAMRSQSDGEANAA